MGWNDPDGVVRNEHLNPSLAIARCVRAARTDAVHASGRCCRSCGRARDRCGRSWFRQGTIRPMRLCILGGMRRQADPRIAHVQDYHLEVRRGGILRNEGRLDQEHLPLLVTVARSLRSVVFVSIPAHSRGHATGDCLLTFQQWEGARWIMTILEHFPDEVHDGQHEQRPTPTLPGCLEGEWLR